MNEILLVAPSTRASQTSPEASMTIISNNDNSISKHSVLATSTASPVRARGRSKSSKQPYVNQESHQLNVGVSVHIYTVPILLEPIHRHLQLLF